MDNLLFSSCRLAFAALIHDIGKFAERAKLDIPQNVKENNKHIFCPKDKFGNPTHIHAAYTGIALDAIEKFLPKINNAETFPFQTNEKDDSIIGAASKHHRPDTYLQHIISTADRLSSAFERSKYDEYNIKSENEDYQRARLIPLFEKLNKDESKVDYNYRYPLKELSPSGIFPTLKPNLSKEDATAEYKILWSNFIEDIQKTHNKNWDLWLDCFDTLYSIYTQNIPSASYKTIPDVSLYDHSKSTAAIATALWRYHYETQSETLDNLHQNEINKFLLIQADTSGIQKFIFDVGKNTRKSAYKILRGRSFFISLVSECASLKILQALNLPSTSQILNAAGKFIILAPNTPSVKSSLDSVKNELTDWLLNKFHGELSIAVSYVEASQKDFEEKQFKELQSKIHQSLSLSKLQQFNLCEKNAGTCENFFNNFSSQKGLCCFDGKLPAENNVSGSEDYACNTCLDILSLGENLANKNLINIAESPVENGFVTDMFGYYIGWKYTENAIRLWDISLPKPNEHMFNGSAKRYINAYVPRFTAADVENKLYQKFDIETVEKGKIKTFSHLALENCTIDNDIIKVKSAIMCLKGDIDNLGALFQQITSPTFATFAQFSRQINNFFTIWLPHFQSTDSIGKNIYTIFAGGDDFYIVGPWLDLINFVPILKAKFTEYVCNRQDITFSAGMCMTRSGDDVVNMSSMVEDALEQAKSYQDKQKHTTKNAVCCFGEVVSFAEYNEMLTEVEKLEEYSQKYGLSINYIYSLQTLCEQAQRAKSDQSFTDAMWRSKLVYRTARFIEQSKSANITEENKTDIINSIVMHIGSIIEKYTTKYKIALYTWLYQQRER